MEILYGEVILRWKLKRAKVKVNKNEKAKIVFSIFPANIFPVYFAVSLCFVLASFFVLMGEKVVYVTHQSSI